MRSDLNNLNIKIAKLSDLKSYRELRLSALKTTPTAFRNSYEDITKLKINAWRKRLNSPDLIIFLAKINNLPVGMVGAQLNNLRKTKHIAKMVEFYVEKKYQNSKVGQKLLNSFLAHLNEKNKILKIQLYVNKDLKFAINIYKKFNFKITGTLRKELKIRNFFYDEFVMEKIFKMKK